MSYDNTNRGALWRNENRESDRHPNLKGELNVDGVEYWVSAWTSNEGGRKPVVSFSIKRKDSQRAPNPQKQQDERNPPDFDDDLPF